MLVLLYRAAPDLDQHYWHSVLSTHALMSHVNLIHGVIQSLSDFLTGFTQKRRATKFFNHLTILLYLGRLKGLDAGCPKVFSRLSLSAVPTVCFLRLILATSQICSPNTSVFWATQTSIVTSQWWMASIAWVVADSSQPWAMLTPDRWQVLGDLAKRLKVAPVYFDFKYIVLLTRFLRSIRPPWRHS